MRVVLVSGGVISGIGKGELRTLPIMLLSRLLESSCTGLISLTDSTS
jgi:hypothetical protein